MSMIHNRLRPSPTVRPHPSTGLSSTGRLPPPIGTRGRRAPMKTGSVCRRSNVRLTPTWRLAALLLCRGRFFCVGNDLGELHHGQGTRHAEFADDESRRAAEFERGRLILVAGQRGADGAFVACEIAVEAIDIDAAARKCLTNFWLGELGVDGD